MRLLNMKTDQLENRTMSCSCALTVPSVECALRIQQNLDKNKWKVNYGSHWIRNYCII